MNTSPASTLDRSALASLAAAVAADGIRSADDDVQRLVTRLRCQGLHGVALDVLADDRQPDVARERAFGLVHGLALAAAAPAAVAGQLVAA